MRITCRACFGPMPTYQGGRPPETCSPECLKKWRAARERARSARAELLARMERVIPWAERLSPELGQLARRLESRARNLEPASVAKVPHFGRVAK